MDIVSPLKQLGKYTVGAAWDTVSSYTDNVSTLASDAREIRDNVMHAGKTSVEIFNDFRMNGMKKFNDWFWQGEGDFAEYDLGNADEDFDAGFQIDNGNYGEEETESSQILDARSMKDITRGQVSAMYKIGGKQVEAATMNTAEIVKTMNERSSEIVASVNSVNTTLAKISKQLDVLGSKMYDSDKDDYKNRGMRDGITDSEGKLTIGNVVKATLKELSQYTDMFGMVKDMAGMMGPRDLIGMGFGYLAEHKIDKLGGKSLADYLESFNRSFGNKMDEFLSTIIGTDLVKYNTSLGRRGGNKNFQHSVVNHYNTDAAKFDGITRQTIVEIIPGYLRSINEALTGQNLQINEKGHLTTKKVDTFGDVASIAMRYDGMKSSTSSRISRRIKTLNTDYNSTDVRDAGRALSGVYVYMAYYNGWTVLDNDMIRSLSNDAIDKAVQQLSRTNSRRTPEQWREILVDVSMQIFADDNAIREFAQNVVRQCESMINKAENVAKTTTRPQDVRRITMDMIFDEYGSNNARQNALDEINEKYKNKVDTMQDQLYDAKHVHINVKEIARLTAEMKKLQDEIEEEREKVYDKYDTDSSDYSASSIKPTGGLFNNTKNEQLSNIFRYTASIYDLLNRGINVRVDWNNNDLFPKKNPRMSMQYFAHKGNDVDDVQTFPPTTTSASSNNASSYTPASNRSNNRETRTPSGSGTSVHSSDDGGGDVPIPLSGIDMNGSMDKIRRAFNGASGSLVNLFNKIIDNTPLKNNKFVQEHRPSMPDPTSMNVDGSDKSYFDMVRTAISAALSNGNGVEDLNDINTMINKIKNPNVRANVKRYAEKMIRMNSKKADAENEKQTDPNLPPEKKPGILGGIAQLFMGKAKTIFSPILTLLTPITSLVKVISKPLIELAKKGFKSGINDIKSGAKQIWGAIKPKGLPSFGKNDTQSATGQEEIVGNENKTTADAGQAAGIGQQKTLKNPLESASYPKSTSTSTNNTGWNSNNSTQYNLVQNAPQISTNNNIQQPVAPVAYANNTGWNSSSATQYNLVQNAPQISTTNGSISTLKDPLAPAKTTAVEGSATGTASDNNKESETAKNTKETSKLGSIMKGVGSITQGLVKIALTIIGSLTAVKTAVDLVIRVIKRAIQPLNNGIRRLVKAIKPVVKSLGKLVGQLAGFVTKLIDSLMGIVQPIMDMLTPLIDTVMKVLEPIMLSIDNIVDIAVKTLEPLMPVVNLLLDNVSTTLMMITDLIDQIVVPFTEAIQPIIEDFGEIFSPFIEDLMETLEPIRDMISTTVSEVIAPAVGKFIYSLIPAVEDMANVIKFGFGMVEMHVGAVETGLGTIVSGIGKLVSLIHNEAGSKMVEAGQRMQQTGEQTSKSGLQNVNDAILYALQRVGILEKTEEKKKEVEIPAPTNTNSNLTFHGSVMDGLTGSGDPHDQHAYGGFLNMSDHGCGPVALADMAARRGGGTINAANLAFGMANSGAYGINDGTSISGFMNTAASMGLGTQLGGVTASSLSMASPDNPITIIGSGYGFGTRNGNNHYMNVIGTNSTGGAYVSNPLTGRIEVHSAAGLANSALAGIYGSGDVSSATTDMNEQIQTLRDTTSGLTTIGDSSAASSTGVDLGSVVEDAFADLKEITSKLLGIFNFDGTFETNVKKKIGAEEDSAIIKNYKSSMTDEEYEAYVQQARALFQKENPKKFLESDKKYEQRFQENLATYLSRVAADATKTKKVDLLAHTYTAQTQNLENTYGKYDPESDAFIDEDHGSIVAMVSDVVNSKAGAGIMDMILKLVGNGVLGNLTSGIVNTLGGVASTVGNAISSAMGTSDTSDTSFGSMGDSVTSALSSAYGGDNYFSNAVNDANYAGSMVSTGGVRLGGANYIPTITVPNVTNSGSASMTQTPIHEFLARAAGQGHAWSADGNWYSKRNTPNTEGVGSTSTSHSGVDILMPDRQTNSVPLYATTDGTVVAIRSGVTGPDHTNNTAGNAVYWTDAAGYKHRFLHLANTTPLVKEGQQIYGGQTLLGYMGNTGDSYGHHLHYDISTPGGQTVNPMTYFQFATGSPQSDSMYSQNALMYEDTDYYGATDYIDPSQYLRITGVIGDSIDGSSYSYGGASGYYGASYNGGGSSYSYGGGTPYTSTTTTNTKTTGKTGTLTSLLPGVKSANAVKSNVSDKYSNSGLVTSGMDYRDQFQNKSSERTNDITTVTWHVWSTGGDMSSFMPNMTDSSRQMSPTYAIDSNGNIAQFVDEGRRPWTTNGQLNDSRAITFEIANVPGVSDKNKYAKGYNEQYPITDASMQSALDLTVDIARRNGINYFYYTGNNFRDADLNSSKYKGGASPGNFTYHTQFVDKACPGEYIISKTDEIIQTLNNRISQGRGAAIAGLDQATIEKAYAGEASTLDAETQALIDKYTIKRYATDQWEAQSYAAHNNMITQAEKKKLKDLGIDTTTLYAPSSYTSAGTSTTGTGTKVIPQTIMNMLQPTSNGDNDSDLVYSYLVSQMGLSPEAAAGVMGNMQAESVLRANNLQDSYNNKFGLTDEQYTQMVDSGQISRSQFINDSAGYGLAQFTYSGWKEILYDTAKERGTSVGDAMTQMVALDKMLDQMPGLKYSLQNTNSVQSAADMFLEQYERPKVYNYSTRRNNAWDIYNQYGGWTPTSVVGTANTDGSAYANMLNYYNYMISGDTSYLQNANSVLGIANDMIRLGNYSFNAGAGLSDYSSTKELQDLFKEFYDKNANGWQLQNQSFGVYFEEGNPVSYVTRDEHGSWEETPIVPRGTYITPISNKSTASSNTSSGSESKPQSTPDTGGAPNTSSGDSGSPSKSNISMANANTAKDWTSHYGGYTLKMPTSISEAVNMAGNVGSSFVEGLKQGASGALQGMLISSLIPNQAKQALGTLGIGVSGTAAASYGIGKLFNWASEYDKSHGTTLSDIASGLSYSIENGIPSIDSSGSSATAQLNSRGIYSLNTTSSVPQFITDYIYNYGSLDAPITSYEQSVARGQIGSYLNARTNEVNKNRANAAASLAQENTWKQAMSKQQYAVQNANAYDRAKAVYDAAVDAYNNYMTHGGATGYAQLTKYTNAIHAAQAEMNKYKAYEGYVLPSQRGLGSQSTNGRGYYQNSNGGWSYESLGTTFWEDMAERNKSTYSSNKAKIKSQEYEQQRQHQQALANEMLNRSDLQSNGYMQALAAKEAAARKGNQTSILTQLGLYTESLDPNIAKYLNDPTHYDAREGSMYTNTLSGAYSGYNMWLAGNNSTAVQNVINDYIKLHGSIDSSTAASLAAQITSGGSYTTLSDLLHAGAITQKYNQGGSSSDPVRANTISSAYTQALINGRISKNATSNASLLQQTITAIEGNTGVKLTDAQKANYAQMIRNGINPLTQVTNTGVTGTNGQLTQTGLLNLAKAGTSVASQHVLSDNELDMWARLYGTANAKTVSTSTSLSDLPGMNLLGTAKSTLNNTLSNVNAAEWRTWSGGVSDQLYQINYAVSGQDMARGLTGYTGNLQTGTNSVTLSDALQAKKRENLVARYNANKNQQQLQTYISDYETKNGVKLTDAQKASYAQIINLGGTPEDFQRYTSATGKALAAQQFVDNMPKATISSSNTEYGSSWTEHYSGPSKSATSNSTSRRATVSNYAQTTNSAASTAKTSSSQASIAYQQTKTQQNKTAQTKKAQSNAKTTNAKASKATTASNAASIAYQNTIKNKKTGKGDPDITPSTITNVDIPDIDLNKLLGNDSTTSTPKITYTSSTQYTTSKNSALNQILNNTFDVRAKRVEELLESIDKKLDSYNKKPNNPTPTSTTTPSDKFPNNGVPAQIDRLALG